MKKYQKKLLFTYFFKVMKKMKNAKKKLLLTETVM